MLVVLIKYLKAAFFKGTDDSEGKWERSDRKHGDVNTK